MQRDPESDLVDPGGHPAGAFLSPAANYKPAWWLHITLFLATFASTTVIGGLFWGGLTEELAQLPLERLLIHPAFIAQGLLFSVPLIVILLAHELGHYFACRAHGLVATPPFFIPFPVPLVGIGTLGAVIRVKEPIRNKGQLLDVGAAGPIAGFVTLLPFLIFGILASDIGEISEEAAYIVFGEPIIYRVFEWALMPDLPEGVGVMLHPTGVAAWFGVMVTLLNMLPFAQLDGGHVCYSLFGHWHRRAAWPMLAILAVLGFVWPGWWLWMVIVLVMGLRHPRIWDEAVPLDPKRQLTAWVAIAIFVLC
ncbi:MAG: site-2 protease family protein, partial [bacterium]|nr:site-2 protease family protein [bacterium]